MEETLQIDSAEDDGMQAEGMHDVALADESVNVQDAEERICDRPQDITSEDMEAETVTVPNAEDSRREASALNPDAEEFVPSYLKDECEIQELAARARLLSEEQSPSNTPPLENVVVSHRGERFAS